MKAKLAKRIAQKKNHFDSYSIWSEIKRVLTIFTGIESRIRGAFLRQVKEAAVDCDAGSDKGEKLEIVHFTIDIGLLFESEDRSKEKKEEDSECLNSSTLRAQEDRDENHDDFPEHYHWLPIIPLQSISIIQEAETFSNLFIRKP